MKVNLTAQVINLGHGKYWFLLSLWNTCSGPTTAPTSRSATVRFIMRYVLRLRRWRILAKAMIVMALIINIRENSVMKTGSKTEISSVAISLNEIQESSCDRRVFYIYYNSAEK